jgi:hypothetical protein
MRYTLLTSCAIAAIAVGVGSAKAQAPAQTQSPGQTQTGQTQTGQTQTGQAQTPGHEQARPDGSQRQREPMTSPGRQPGDERSNANMGRRDAGERREERSDRQDRFGEDRGRRGEQERFGEERGRRGEHERFSEERRRGDDGWREERRYRTERDFDRDRGRRFDDRRYGDRREEWRFEDRRSGGTVGRAYEGSRTQISRRQRARVHDILVRRRVEPVNIDFPIRVGARVPNYISSYTLPEEVYEYLPGYEGYRYFVAGDEVVIIDPETMEIVSVLED